MGYDRTVLARLIRQKRLAEGRSVRDAARHAGVSHATLNRMEREKPADGDSLYAVLIWLGEPISALQGGDSNQQSLLSEAPPASQVQEAKSGFQVHLRAPRNLDASTAAAIAEAFRQVATFFESRGAK